MSKLNNQGVMQVGLAGWKQHHKFAATAGLTGAVAGAALVVLGDAATSDSEIAFGVILAILSIGLVCLSALRGWIDQRIKDAMNRAEQTLERARVDSDKRLEDERNTLHGSHLAYTVALNEMERREAELDKAKADWELAREAEVLKAYALGLEHAQRAIEIDDAQPGVVLNLQHWKNQRDAAGSGTTQTRPRPKVVNTDDSGLP
ncbi:hypothetical protein ACFY2W_23420 [Streptomyces sp. NPDC001262]|uniref:hypothetical protein n=1 Tax=Streptomyces sp. NPDC001262 TaxID=3364552 RepID=UPI003698C798